MGGGNETYTSYEEMYTKQYPVVYQYIRRVVRNNDAAVEDLTQEVFFVAYKKWESLREHPNIPGFLMVVAKNKIKKWFEKQSRIHMDDSDLMDLVTLDEQTDRGIDEYKMVDFYSSVENTLSNRDLNILRHYYEYGYTSSEMAKKLGITESCFKVRVARMKEKLKSSLSIVILLAVGCAAVRLILI